MTKRSATHEAVLGLDVGKSSHWACLVTREGEVRESRRVDNREEALDELVFRQEHLSKKSINN